VYTQLLGLGVQRGPSFALMVMEKGAPPYPLYSDPVRKRVETDAAAKNADAERRGNKLRYKVEERVPISLGTLWAGTSLGYAKVDPEKTRRIDGC
jgi:hypothetical protein